jgi:hypothetical protein
MDIHQMIVLEGQYFSTTNSFHPLNQPKVNPTTIPNPNRLSAMLMSVDEGEGSELR